MWDLVRSRGCRLFKLDSDGNIESVLPAMIDGGVNLPYPMEPAAGMDIVKTRAQYGTQLAFIGGIDKHVIRGSKEEISRELEYKIPPMVRTGGCVFGARPPHPQRHAYCELSFLCAEGVGDPGSRRREIGRGLAGAIRPGAML